MQTFFDKMKDLLGEDYPLYLEESDKPPYKGIRVNTLKIQPDILVPLLDFVGEKTPFAEDGYYVTREHLGTHPMHHAGAFYVQEPSAMSAVTALGVEKGDKVLDLCAAPGSKSTQIASRLDGTGLLWANEIIRPRAHILLSNIERMGVHNAVVSNMSPEALCTQLEGFFDKVLVDAPCSGEGMFRKDWDAIYEWSPEHSKACAVRQKAILNSAKKALKKGGVMVYSTCTFSREENEGVIEAFLEENPDFELIDTGCTFGVASMEYCRRIYPFHGGEGHFVAKLRKNSDCADKGGVFSYQAPSTDEQKMIAAFMEDILRDPKQYGNITVINGRILSYPDLALLPDFSGLNILRAGVKLGDFKTGRIEPHHNLATAAKPDEFQRRLKLELDDELVVKYIRGEEIEIDTWIKGWSVVAVEGISLGLGKASAGKLKNKYPKGLRTLSWRT